MGYVWTPIDEGLPKKQGKYLCTTEDNQIDLYYFTLDLGGDDVYQPVGGDWESLWENGRTELCEKGKPGFCEWTYGDGMLMLRDDITAYMFVKPYKKSNKG